MPASVSEGLAHTGAAVRLNHDCLAPIHAGAALEDAIMADIRHILLPTDFAELAAHAASYAASLAQRYNADLHVVHVIPLVPDALPGPEAGGILLPIPSTEDLTGLQEELDLFVRTHCQAEGVPVTKAMLKGRPEAVVCEYVRAHAIDLVVIGTHARGLVSRIFFGSVSKSVLEHAGCPVLMVPLFPAAPSPLPPPASPTDTLADS